MPSIRLVASTGLDTDVSIACLFTPVLGSDEDVALARAVMVALNTDGLADADATLPGLNDDNRRGWWGDLDTAEIWGGWPIGSQLWLMSRDKITDQNAKQGSTLEKANRFINAALQPFVDLGFCSSFDVSLAVLSGPNGPSGIGGTITIYRGPKSAIALAYQDLWTTYGG